MLLKKIRIICDSLLFWGGLLLSISQIVIAVVITIMLETGYISASTIDDKNKSQVLFVFFAIFLFFGVILCLPRWLMILTLDEKEITFRGDYFKPYTKSYNQFPYVYIATYRHGSLIGLGVKVRYIVISQIKLTEYELTHINRVFDREKIFKIRYSKKKYDALLNVLPKSHKERLETAMWKYENSDNSERK